VEARVGQAETARVEGQAPAPRRAQEELLALEPELELELEG
jgi:hypothetical protein